jgi:hypothetical protein
MDWQQVAVVAIVAAATYYLGRQTWRTWSGRKAGCGGSCDCSSKPAEPPAAALIPPDQITLRRRQTGPL